MILRAHLSCSVKEAASKNTKYLQNDNFLKIAKIGQNAWAIAFAYGHFGSKIKIRKNL